MLAIKVFDNSVKSAFTLYYRLEQRAQGGGAFPNWKRSRIEVASCREPQSVWVVSGLGQAHVLCVSAPWGLPHPVTEPSSPAAVRREGMYRLGFGSIPDRVGRGAGSGRSRSRSAEVPRPQKPQAVSAVAEIPPPEIRAVSAAALRDQNIPFPWEHQGKPVYEEVRSGSENPWYIHCKICDKDVDDSHLGCRKHRYRIGHMHEYAAYL